MTGLDVKKIRKELGLTQKEFAEKLKIHYRTVQKWESGETEIQQKNILHIKNTFSTQENTPKTTTFQPNQEVFISSNDEMDIFYNKNGNKYSIKNDGSIDIEVVCLPFPAYASYLEVYMDEQQVLENFSTATFRVDKIGKGYYMAFNVKGDSMNGGGINDTPDGASILAREIGRHLWNGSFKHEKYGYILMTKNCIFHKDIKDYNANTGKLTLTSRNADCEDFELDINDVNRIFNVIKRNF